MAKFRFTYDPNQEIPITPPVPTGDGFLGEWFIGAARNARYAERGTGGLSFSTTPAIDGTAAKAGATYTLAETFAVGDQLVIAQFNQFGVLQFVQTEEVTAATLQVDPLNQINLTIENNNKTWLAEGSVRVWRAGHYFPFYIHGNYFGEWQWEVAGSNPQTTYTERGRWNDTSANYRTANDADWTNFGGGSWCANRGPLNNVADPFPLDTTKTYRLRYVQGGSATAASAAIVGTPTQVHIDSSPGGGIACYRFGSSADMINTFGTPISNPNSPPSFNGGQWILEEQVSIPNTGFGTFYTNQAEWTPTLAAVGKSARYVHTTGSITASDVALTGEFPSDLTGTWRLSQVGGASIEGPLTLIDDTGPNKSFRVGNQAQMIAAFGNVEIASGNPFRLEKKHVNDVAPFKAGILNNKLRFNKQPLASWEEIIGTATTVSSNVYTEIARWTGGTATPVTETAYYAASLGCLFAQSTAASGLFPTNTSGIWRLSQVGGSSIQGPIVGDTNVNPANQFRCIQIGSQAEMAMTFGSSNITGGGDWVLEQVQSVSASTHSSWNERTAYGAGSIVNWNGKVYRALVNIPMGEPNPQYDVLRSGTLDVEQFQLSLGQSQMPSADTTNWEQIAAWNGFDAYAVNDLASHNGILFRCLTAQTVPGVAPQSVNISTQLTEQARWNAAGNAGSNGNAFYNSATFNGNANPLSGTVPASNPGGTWTLRQVGGGTITGSINQWSNLGTSFQIRITSQTAMQAAFGTSFIGGGGQWILERQATSTGTINITSNGVVVTQIALLDSSLQVTTTSSLANKQIVISAGTETITFATGQSSHALNASQSSAVAGATSIQFSVQASPPTQNSAPGGSNTAWESVTTTTWNANSPYNQGTLVNVGTPAVYFRAKRAITVGVPMSPTDYTLVWKVGTTEYSGTFRLTGVDSHHFEFDIPTFSPIPSSYFTNLTSGTKVELFPGITRNFTWLNSQGQLQYGYSPAASAPNTYYQLEKGVPGTQAPNGYRWKLRSAQVVGEHYLTYDTGDIGESFDGRQPSKDFIHLNYFLVLPKPWGLFGNNTTLLVPNYFRLYAYDRTSTWRDFRRQFDFHSIVNMNATGFWANQSTGYALDYTSKRIYAYNVNGGQREPANDIELDYLNNFPYGLDSDGTILWVGQAQATGSKLFAYNLSDKTRNTARDITLDTANQNPSDILVIGGKVFVTDIADAKVYAYSAANGARLIADDFNTLNAAGNVRPTGIWSDGTTTWIVDLQQLQIFAYNSSTKARDASKDIPYSHFISRGNIFPGGMAHDNTHMWISDSIDGKIYAYRLSTSDGLDIDSSQDFNTLEAADNRRPKGLWLEGNTMYVVNQGILPAGYFGKWNGRIFSSSALPSIYECLGQAGTYRFNLISDDGITVRATTGTEVRKWFNTNDPIILRVNGTNFAGTVTSATITGTQATVTCNLGVTINAGDRVEVWAASELNEGQAVLGSLGGIKIYAYNKTTKARIPSSDVNTLENATNYKPNGVVLTGSYFYVVDEVLNKIFSYAFLNGVRDTTREINNLDIGANGAPKGLWTDGTTLWVVDRNPPRGQGIQNQIITGITTPTTPPSPSDPDPFTPTGGQENTTEIAPGTTTTTAQDTNTGTTQTTVGPATPTETTATRSVIGNQTRATRNPPDNLLSNEQLTGGTATPNTAPATAPPGSPNQAAQDNNTLNEAISRVESFVTGGTDPNTAPAPQAPPQTATTSGTTSTPVGLPNGLSRTVDAINTQRAVQDGFTTAPGTDNAYIAGVDEEPGSLNPNAGIGLPAVAALPGLLGSSGSLAIGYNSIQALGLAAEVGVLTELASNLHGATARVGTRTLELNIAIPSASQAYGTPTPSFRGGSGYSGAGGYNSGPGSDYGASDGFGGEENGCFEEGTLMRMADGSLKQIQDIQPGDVMKQGGRVLCVMKGNGLMEKWFSYKGVVCTADQRVFEDDGWIRVEDSAHSTPVEQRLYYYDTMNEFHRQEHESGLLFTDFQGAHVVETKDAK